MIQDPNHLPQRPKNRKNPYFYREHIWGKGSIFGRRLEILLWGMCFEKRERDGLDN
jgi:hypothetical protein